MSEKASLLAKIITVFDLDLTEIGELINILDAMFWIKANEEKEGDIN